MRSGLTHGLPVLVASACALPHFGCAAPPPDAWTPAPEARPSAEPYDHPTADDPGRMVSAVRLDALVAERPPLPEDMRNPFRFGPATDTTAVRTPADPTPVGPAEAPVGAVPPGSMGRTTAAAPAAPRVIDTRLRFIGIVDVPATGRVAVVTDERGVYYGRTDDVVDGRYRIVAIETTSIEIEDLTRGVRLTLRPGGS